MVGDRQARASEQPDHGHDGNRTAARCAHLGRGDHRADLRHSGLWPIDDRRRQPARLHVAAGRRARRGCGLRRRQPPRRRRLLAPQPAHSRRRCAVSYADPTLATLSPRARRRRILRRRFIRRPFAIVGLVVALVFVLAAIFAPLVAPYSASATDFNALLKPPFTHGHLLGTDELGRDQLSRIIWGSRASIQAGVLSTTLAMVIAVPIGIVAGYYRGLADTVIARLTDVLLAF